MKQEFYSNGKLLITGEYLVLDGAKAFALPTKFGQKLIVEQTSTKQIHWTSYDANSSVWFQEIISFDEILKWDATQHPESLKNTLVEILFQAYLLNPSFIVSAEGYNITTELSFPRHWGLGTSSTLINNIAQWVHVDAFGLLKNSFGGSGYDIACALNSTAILYRLESGTPIIQPFVFKPDFVDQLYFVYLQQKQSSKASILSYLKKKENRISKEIVDLDKITLGAVHAKNLNEFSIALQEHEALLSTILEKLTVKEALFPDFKGTVKSLGAWGGDFVLVLSEENPSDYFKAKGYPTILSYNEMIL